jgi:hypothetical protein
MRKMLAVTAAVAALTLGATAANAVDEKEGYYVTGSGENRMVMGGQNSEGTRLLSAENGAAPSDCPEGSFYEMNEMIFACGDDDTAYMMVEPDSGATMATGEAYPEGAMMLEHRENQQ